MICLWEDPFDIILKRSPRWPKLTVSPSHRSLVLCEGQDVEDHLSIVICTMYGIEGYCIVGINITYRDTESSRYLGRYFHAQHHTPSSVLVVLLTDDQPLVGSCSDNQTAPSVCSCWPCLPIATISSWCLISLAVLLLLGTGVSTRAPWPPLITLIQHCPNGDRRPRSNRRSFHAGDDAIWIVLRPAISVHPAQPGHCRILP